MNDQNAGSSPAASLDDVLITDRLSQRPSRPPDHAAENRALSELARTLAEEPEALLQKLVDLVVELCRADSAGISIYEQGQGPGVFRWPAVAGMWAHHADGSPPRGASPCGVVIDRDAPLLFEHPGRHFPDVAAVAPELLEVLLVPFHADGKPAGTVWANAHIPGKEFDAEDLRLLTSLSRFASAAHQMTAALRDTAAARALVERDSQAYAQSIVDTMRDPLLVLDADLRVISASREFYRSFGVSPEETVGTLVYELGNRQWDIPRLRTLLEEVLPGETAFRDFEVEHTFEHIGRKVMLLNAREVHREGDGGGQILLVIEDATERRDAEEARREAEARFTEMVKNVRDHSIFLTDPEGVITSWNVTAERIIGYSEGEAVGRHFSLIFSPEDVQDGVPEQELRQAREEGRAEDERWHLRKGGEPFWALGIVTPLHEPGGRLSGFSKILRDITDRKRADEALRESQARLRLALAAARMGIWTLHLDAGIQMRDANLNRLLGLEPEETTGPFEEFLTHIHPEDKSAVREGFAASVEQFRPLNIEFRVVWPDGTVRWLRDQGDVFGDAAGGSRHMAGACVDVTDLKQAEDGLRTSEKRLRAVAANLPNAAVFVVNHDLRYELAEGDALREAGFVPANLEGKTVREALGPALADEYEPRYRSALGGEEFRAEHAAHGRHFVSHGVPLLDPAGRAVAALAVSYDITERVRAEEEVRRARDELEARVAERTADLRAEIERRKDLARRLVTAQEDERRRVSRDLHDSVGQLLAGLSMAFKAVESAGELPPHTAGKLAEAQAIVESLGKEAHGLAVRLRPTSLDDIGLEPALGQLVAEWSSRTGVRADFNSSGMGPGRLTPEIETTLYRVVQEALTNVAKHARASVVSVVVSRPDRYVTAVIEDDGAGFDPGAAPKGRLGLLGMRERTSLVGGEMDVESAPGSGTTVYVRIPITGGEGSGS